MARWDNVLSSCPRYLFSHHVARRVQWAIDALGEMIAFFFFFLNNLFWHSKHIKYNFLRCEPPCCVFKYLMGFSGSLDSHWNSFCRVGGRGGGVGGPGPSSSSRGEARRERSPVSCLCQVAQHTTHADDLALSLSVTRVPAVYSPTQPCANM